MPLWNAWAESAFQDRTDVYLAGRGGDLAAPTCSLLNHSGVGLVSRDPPPPTERHATSGVFGLVERAVSYSLAFAASAAVLMVVLIWWLARKHGLPRLATTPLKTRGLSSSATRAAAGQVKAAHALSIKSKKFGKR